MTARAQKIKAIVKGTPPQMTYGTNPRDPWSAKANMSEDAALDKYLLSRGINPQFATKDQKVAHSKTSTFINWKRNRMLEDTLEEKVDKKDTVTLDIPLLIRVLELAREDIKTDMDLHRVVEKLINIRNKGMLTMKDYNYISKIHEEVMPLVSENHIAIAMGKEMDDEGSMIMNQLDQIERSINMMRDVVKDPKMQVPAWVQSKVTLAADYIETVAGYMSSKNEEVESIDEISTDGYYKAAAKSRMDSAVKVASSMGKDKQAMTKLNARNTGMKRVEKRTQGEMKKANSGPQLPRVGKEPTEAERRGYGQGRYMGDSVEHQDETIIEAQSAALRFQKALQREKAKREEQERKDAESKARAEKLLNPPKPMGESKVSEYSKSARIIKSIYKKKGVTEELYDHEKEDKSVATYGKKPKVVTNDPKDSFGENKPDAAAVLKGGTTLTGQKRDVVEIDPMMRKRLGSDPTGKNK